MYTSANNITRHTLAYPVTQNALQLYAWSHTVQLHRSGTEMMYNVRSSQIISVGTKMSLQVFVRWLPTIIHTRAVSRYADYTPLDVDMKYAYMKSAYQQAAISISPRLVAKGNNSTPICHKELPTTLHAALPQTPETATATSASVLGQKVSHD